MKKFKAYYTNPLSAAWMMQEFDINLVSINGNKLYYLDGDICFGLPDPSDPSRLMKVIDGDKKHFIIPEDLKLYLPQVGDRIVWPNSAGRKVTKSSIKSMERHHQRLTELYGTPFYVKIIERNGKPFHWPEFEGGA